MSNVSVSLVLGLVVTTPQDEDGSFPDELDLFRIIPYEYVSGEYEYNEKQLTESKAITIQEIVYCDAKLSVEVTS